MKIYIVTKTMEYCGFFDSAFSTRKDAIAHAEGIASNYKEGVEIYEEVLDAPRDILEHRKIVWRSWENLPAEDQTP